MQDDFQAQAERAGGREFWFIAALLGLTHWAWSTHGWQVALVWFAGTAGSIIMTNLVILFAFDANLTAIRSRWLWITLAAMLLAWSSLDVVTAPR